MSKNDSFFNQFHSQISNLEGKMLTIIDAVIVDTQQKIAVKSLVRNEIWDWFYANSPPGAVTASSTASSPACNVTE